MALKGRVVPTPNLFQTPTYTLISSPLRRHNSTHLLRRALLFGVLGPLILKTPVYHVLHTIYNTIYHILYIICYIHIPF